ncbi:Putative hemagglutinin-related protein [Geitlerinema sp. FC II]|nr:Putative hemagglutinin-related protein [Geitlerinema sp. FC II]
MFLGSAGSGISGELRVVADEIELDRSDIGTSIFTDGMSGDITIVANSLKLNNGSSIFSATSTSILDDIFDDESVPDLLRRGSSGNINIRVRDTLELQGTNFDTNSSISSSVLGVGNSGNISIEASRLRLADGARILTQAENGNVGEINLRITGDMTLDGFQEIGFSQFPTSINTQSTGTGDTGNISIEAERLTLTNGARISTATTNSGNAGSIRVEASEILLDGEILENALQPQPTQITTDVFTENAVVTGLGGTLTLNADRITISNGAQISALTFSQGDAGSIAIQTTELQAIDGTISTQTFGPGNAGAIEIDAQTVRLSDGATLTSGASFPDPFNLEGDRNVGRGGTITVRASELLELDSGSQILGDVSVNTDSQGGNIILDGDRVRIRGGSSVTSSNFGIGNAGTVNLRANDLQIIGSSSRLLAEANGGIIVDPARFTDLIGGSDPTADLSSIIELTRAVGGTIAVDAERLEVRDGGTISVSSGGISEPGNVQLQIGDRLRLDNRGRIAASSVTGNGGNININARNIRLRRRSQMSAAGSPVDPTFDGNITLNTETLALLEGSQIVTSSADPQGGSNIEIRPWENDLVVLQSPDSLINATGQLAIEGDIDVQQPDLPEVDVVDAAAILATDPCATGRDSEFYITGRGGLPPNPESILPGDATWVDLRSPHTATPESTRTRDDETSQLVEAQGWYVNPEGNVVLSAQTANAEPNLPQPQPDSCSPNNSTR